MKEIAALDYGVFEYEKQKVSLKDARLMLQQDDCKSLSVKLCKQSYLVQNARAEIGGHNVEVMVVSQSSMEGGYHEAVSNQADVLRILHDKIQSVQQGKESSFDLMLLNNCVRV